MLYDNMNIFRLMVYARGVEKEKDKRKIRNAKRDMSFDGGSSRKDFIYKIILNLRSANQIKSLPNS